VLTLGLPDVFTDHGDPAKILAALGLDAAGIEASILGRFPELATPAPTRPALAAVG
jgi:1-deoxy-D-xylulose-5-phosphate synthase